MRFFFTVTTVLRWSADFCTTGRQ